MFTNLADKVAFVNHIPLLTQATADDGQPTPGYLLGEIKNITFHSESSCRQLFDYIIHRLNKSSNFVKIKVLKIIIYLIHNGHVRFRQHLCQCDGPIKVAALHYGPSDPLLGNAPYKEIQKLAQEVLDLIFDPELMKQEEAKCSGLVPLQTLGGMGSSAVSAGKYDGFGNTAVHREGTVTDKMLDYLGRLIHPTEDQNSEVIRAALHSSPGDYQPVSVVSSTLIESGISTEPTLPKLQFEKSHTPGRAGGGWESDEDLDETEKNCAPPQSLVDSSTHSDNCNNDSANNRPDDSSSVDFEKLLSHYCESNEHPTIDELDETCLLCPQEEYINMIPSLENMCTKLLIEKNEPCLMRVLLLWEWIYYTIYSSRKASESSTCILNNILALDDSSHALKSKARKLRLIILNQQQASIT